MFEFYWRSNNSRPNKHNHLTFLDPARLSQDSQAPYCIHLNYKKYVSFQTASPSNTIHRTCFWNLNQSIGDQTGWPDPQTCIHLIFKNKTSSCLMALIIVQNQGVTKFNLSSAVNISIMMLLTKANVSDEMVVCDFQALGWVDFTWLKTKKLYEPQF